MYIKKIILFFVFITSLGYFLYDISIKATSFFIDYQMNKSVLQMPDTLYLHTENGILKFQRQKTNKYCSANTCGFVKNLSEHKFDFYWEKYNTLKFKKSPTEKNVFVLDTPSLNKKNPLINMTFKLHENNLIKHLSCTAEKCFYNDKSIAPFDFVISGRQISKEEPFEAATNINQSTFLILKNKKGEFLTFQKKEDVFIQTPTKENQNKFLFIISSYKRPVYLSGLIHSLNFQTYPSQKFDISVSLKGLHQDVQTYLLKPDFNQAIETKKLILRRDGNKNQFSNMLDTFRDIDLSTYDYICKINDNDWYHKDYLSHLNLLLNALDKPSFITSGILNSLEKDPKEVYLKTKTTSRTGPSMCFSNTFAKQLLQIEKMPNQEIEPLLKKDAYLTGDIKTYYEDLILNAYAQQQDEKFIYFSLQPLFIYNQTTKSIMGAM